MLRAEIGQTMNTAAATQTDTPNIQLLANEQKFFAATYDWPFLEDKWDVTAAAGGQYVTLPATNVAGDAATLNIERPIKIETFFNTHYFELEYGIGAEEYNDRNSFASPKEQEDQIQRWTFADPSPVGPATRIEVWPVPLTQQPLRFTGQRTVRALSAGSDTCDLDDILLVKSVAARILARNEQPDAALVAAQAKQRLDQIRQAYPIRTRSLILGRAPRTRAQIRAVPIVLVH